ncbi:unannotated protein [freshwater metagenome]|uniref:Unannotated protein n=1 Tax=freshwater metagenome TaxID=449393 RepID=A0A6J7D9U4_9ZZZZ
MLYQLSTAGKDEVARYLNDTQTAKSRDRMRWLAAQLRWSKRRPRYSDAMRILCMVGVPPAIAHP